MFLWADHTYRAYCYYTTIYVACQAQKETPDVKVWGLCSATLGCYPEVIIFSDRRKGRCVVLLFVSSYFRMRADYAIVPDLIRQDARFQSLHTPESHLTLCLARRWLAAFSCSLAIHRIYVVCYGDYSPKSLFLKENYAECDQQGYQCLDSIVDLLF